MREYQVYNWSNKKPPAPRLVRSPDHKAERLVLPPPPNRCKADACHKLASGGRRFDPGGLPEALLSAPGDKSNLGGWLMRLAANLAYNYLRGEERRRRREEGSALKETCGVISLEEAFLRDEEAAGS